MKGFSVPAVVLACVGLSGLVAEPTAAEVRIVTADGEYRMGPRDTREDAVRLATEQAKRHALEQVATYLESVTVVTNLDVTSDEIRTYTAGLILVLSQQTSTRLEGETVVIRVDLTAQVDTDEVAQAIAALRQNEDARSELVALRSELDQLHQQLDAANQALQSAATPDQVQTLSQQRQEMLNQVQTNALVSQAWTDWVLVTPIVRPVPWIGLRQVQGLITQAQQLTPANPHVRIVQQVIMKQAASPGTSVMPQPPLAKPAAPSSPSSVPTQAPPPRVDPPPSVRHLPPTLNQVHTPPPTHVPRAAFQLQPRSPSSKPSSGEGHGSRKR